MKRDGLNKKGVKCFGCGKVLNIVEQEIGLCKSCSEGSIEEGFEMVDAEERDEVRAEAMMYV
jgi:hypothetical protein